MSDREKLAFGLALVAAIVVPGLGAAAIHSQGYSTLGTATWVIGYGSGIVAIWYVWFRPLDLRGPTSGQADDPASGENVDPDE